ncbi:MAG: (deoxy)nucleoside triphosphate pyrophosphohydrolase [Anaerovoracaceae bacterium]
MKHLEVAGAILIKDGKILCAKRGNGIYEYTSQKYEFPGGKLEGSESPKEALHRELIEEMDLNIDIDNMELFYIVEHQYPDFFIKMHCFISEITDEKINLKEHLDMQWKTTDDILDLDWAAADFPVVEALVNRGI